MVLGFKANLKEKYLENYLKKEKKERYVTVITKVRIFLPGLPSGENNEGRKIHSHSTTNKSKREKDNTTKYNLKILACETCAL